MATRDTWSGFLEPLGLHPLIPEGACCWADSELSPWFPFGKLFQVSTVSKSVLGKSHWTSSISTS